MGRLTRLIRPVGAAFLVASMLAAGAFTPAVTRAADQPDIRFGEPTATSNFGSGIDFGQPLTAGQDVARAELLLTVANARGPEVVSVEAPGARPSRLGYRLATSDRGLLPNTPIRARWRVFTTEQPSVAAVGPEIRVVYADDRFDWQTVSGDLVRLHWYKGDPAFGRRALNLGEQAVADTSKLLGVKETDPVDVFVYADQEAFADALGPGTRERSIGGQAHAEIRTLFALITPQEIDDAWVGIVVPHELVHLVFDTAVHNPYHFPPRWLNEGLAVYQSQGYDPPDRAAVAGAARAGTLLPLEALIGQFPSADDRFALAYAESVSSVDYLIRRFGQAALVKLIRSYQGGLTDDEAFQEALGIDVAGFEAAWLADLRAKPPTAFGPQPAPAGPVPADWGPAPAADGQGGDATAAPESPGAPRPVGGPSPDLVWTIPIALALIIVGIVFVARRRRPPTEIDQL
ncbi:MAG: peptidase MA family metallohydrolase [Chloroflexota bacterium]